MSDSVELFTDPKMPEALREQVLGQWQQLMEIAEGEVRDWYLQLAEDERRSAQLATLLACSPAAADFCLRFPHWLVQWDAAGELDGGIGAEKWFEKVAVSGEATDEAGLEKGLREFRNRAWLRIVWRDLNRIADTAETTRDLSLLAEASIQHALDFHYQQLCAEWGVPRSKAGDVQQLVVLAMGKLGARELNLSSDIDLMFTFPEGGETQGGARQVDNQQFFIRLGQRVIKALDQRTADGFVFRVDMRLRPYGQSGPLVMSFDAMEEYYQDQGRDWERYAMIKARCVAGDLDAGERLLERLRPFTYRRYVDFSAIESLREMKAMIQREVQRRSLHDNIKLGPGGIREIEFVVQCFQLIRGGHEKSLQERRLLAVLDELLTLNYLPADAVEELREAYFFLRDTEHAVQAWLDRQTQELPDSDMPQMALAWAMACDGDWQAFRERLELHRNRVSTHFANIIAAPEPESDSQRENIEHWQALLDDLSEESARQEMSAAGFEDVDEAARRLVALCESKAVSRMQVVGRERLLAFLPRLLAALGDARRPTRTLIRVLPILEAVLRRTSYLVLLMENPAALRQLIFLCDASVWVARQLSAHPALLDELLDARSLYSVPDKAGLRSELRQQMLRISEDDVEAQMEGLRYFKLAHVLRVAASELSGALPLMKVSDYLSYIAEVVLEYVLELAWQQLVEKHGYPADAGHDGVAGGRFVVIAYGKLGGLELGYGSDLDMVFVHDAGNGMTDGERPLDNSVFYTRLGQRMIHILGAQTRLGKLYEVDMRLRPSGESGLLVSSLQAFADYQRKQAWTWEHQALVRARVVAGDSKLAADVERLRAEILSQSRDESPLRGEVLEMRGKMREHLLSRDEEGEDSPQFHLKQSAGGIVDIEFMVQYAVLAWSHNHPALTTYTDNIRILESLQNEQLLKEADAQALIAAYKAYRSHSHRLSLQEEKGVIAASDVKDHRRAVVGLWQTLMAAGNGAGQ